MADNSVQNGTDTIATDDVTTLNGGASSAVKVQRVKPGFGIDGDFTDVSATNPLPVNMGTDISSPTAMPTGGSGVRGWLSAIWTKLNGILSATLTAGTSRIGQVQLTGNASAAAIGLGNVILPWGAQMCTIDGTEKFTETFDAALDANKWNTGVVTGGMTVAPSGGGLTFTTNTTASASAYIDTVPTFATNGMAFMQGGWIVKLEAQTASKFVTNQYRFCGFGDRPGTFAYATPNSNAYGFEIDGTGQLNAVVYNAGTKIFSQSTDLFGTNLNTYVSAAGGLIGFDVTMRPDSMLFYINTGDVPVATFTFSSTGFAPLTNQTLPLRFCAVNNSTVPNGTSTFIISALGVADLGGNNQRIVDGKYPHIAASVVPKQVQGTYSLQLQDITDAGRVLSTLFMTTPVVTTATDALVSLTGYKNSAAVTATTTPAVVTAGKNFRLKTLTITYVTIATAGSVKFTLRANPSGVAAIGSPAVASWVVGGPAVAAGTTETVCISIPGGMDFAAGTGLGVSMVGLNATQTAAAVGYGQIALTGDEF